MLRWLLAAAHLLALGIGLGAVWVRARALMSAETDRAALPRAFAADGAWGLAALLWIITGLWRLFGATEKPTQYYFGNHAFWTKMALFVVILALEIRPMVTLIRWRIMLAKGELPELHRARGLARISYAQAVLVVLMVLAATAMARGLSFSG
jgi:putative membrane protein